MSQAEQLTVYRGAAALEPVDERAARRSLREQVAKLERELSQRRRGRVSAHLRLRSAGARG